MLTESFKKIQWQPEGKAWAPLKFRAEKQRNGQCWTKTFRRPFQNVSESEGYVYIIWRTLNAKSTERRRDQKNLRTTREGA